MRIDLDNLSDSHAGEIADYVAGGYTAADWLRDQCRHCEVCGEHYDANSDFVSFFDLDCYDLADCDIPNAQEVCWSCIDKLPLSTWGAECALADRAWKERT